MPFRNASHHGSLLVLNSFEECTRRFVLFNDGLYELSQKYVCQFSNSQFKIRERRLYYQQYTSSLHGNLFAEGEHCRLIVRFYPGIGNTTLFRIVFVLFVALGLIMLLASLPMPQDVLFLLLNCAVVVVGFGVIINLLMNDDRRNDEVYQSMLSDLEQLLSS